MHARNPPAAGFAGLRRVAHVDGHEDVIGEAIEQHRGVGPAPASVPEPVYTAAFDGHEADTPGPFGICNVVDRETGAPVAHALGPRGADRLAEGAAVIGALIGKLFRREHVLGVDDEQQVVVRLQMDGPGVRRSLDVGQRARVLRIAHVEHGKAAGEHVRDIGVAAMHHELHAVGPAALAAVADDAHVARVIGGGEPRHRYASRKCGTAIQSSMALSLCSNSCMRRSSSVCKFTPIWVPSLRPCMTMVLPSGWRSALYAFNAASMSSFWPRCFANACASVPALAMPKPICGRALAAASPTIATRPNTIAGEVKS